MRFGEVQTIGSLLALDGIGSAVGGVAKEAIVDVGSKAVSQAGSLGKDAGTSEGAKKANEGRQHASAKAIARANRENVPGGPKGPLIGGASKSNTGKPFKTAYGTAGGGSLSAVGAYNRSKAETPSLEDHKAAAAEWARPAGFKSAKQQASEKFAGLKKHGVVAGRDGAPPSIHDAMPKCVNLDAPMQHASSSGPAARYTGKVL